MFRIRVKTFGELVHEYAFNDLNEATLCFFRYLGSNVHRVEFFQGFTENKEDDRLIAKADRLHPNDPFRLTRLLNIF